MEMDKVTMDFNNAREEFLKYHIEHTKLVKTLLNKIITYINTYGNNVINTEELILRTFNHDSSKLTDELEKNTYINMNLKLKNVKYGTEEYKQIMTEFKDGINKHYQNNSHHPEHYNEGIKNMNTDDLIEMVCDWCAVIKYKNIEDWKKDLEFNKGRFKIDDLLFSKIINTAEFLLDDNITIMKLPNLINSSNSN